MGKVNTNQRGFSIVEGVLVLAVIVIVGAVGLVVYNSHKKATPVAKMTETKSSTSTKPKTDTTTTTKTTPIHTAQEAVAFAQTAYDNYLAAVNRANADPANRQPVAQVGLGAVKDGLSADLYAKAAAVTQATPFSCTAQFVADKYTASLASSDDASALVAVSISNGSGLTTSGMRVTVDLSSLKITAVTCPS
jgi:hypothetical protein